MNISGPQIIVEVFGEVFRVSVFGFQFLWTEKQLDDAIKFLTAAAECKHNMTAFYMPAGDLCISDGPRDLEEIEDITLVMGAKPLTLLFKDLQSFAVRQGEEKKRMIEILSPAMNPGESVIPAMKRIVRHSLEFLKLMDDLENRK